MSFNGAIFWNDMAKFEIHKRTANLYRMAIWRWRLKESVVIPWPRGWVQVAEGVDADSSDPNDWYRPWLEKHAGKQGWDWEWRIHVGASVHSPGYEHLYDDKLLVKFRNPTIATMFALKYS